MSAQSSFKCVANRQLGESPDANDGNLFTKPRPMTVSFQKEITVIKLAFPYAAGAIGDPLDRINAMIADAQVELKATASEAEAATAELAAIEPHPHAHGHSAAGDCAYSSIEAAHFLPLAGLLAQPWSDALARVEAVRGQQGLDYLLKAFPAAFVEGDDDLNHAGARLIDERADLIDDDLRRLYARKPLLAVGMVWRLFNFDRRDRDAWVGAFAMTQLSMLVSSSENVTVTTTLGDALSATVLAHRTMLSALGNRELHNRAARRDAARQASWAAVPEHYRESGPWRPKAPTKRQRDLMRRIEAVRGLPLPIVGRRGATSDAIANAGGNPRFNTQNQE